MANLGNVIKISQADFDLIFNAYPNSEEISTGDTVTYDPNSIYLVEEEEPSWVSQNLSSQNYLNLGD